jgi:hypothetical protein
LNPATGEYVNDLSGSINIGSINSLLRTVVATNPFNNRDPSGNANTASNPVNRNNYTLADGFLQNDLIFVPNGITITLNLNIINNGVLLNATGNNHISTINTDYNNGLFTQETSVTNTNIRRVVTAPLLFKLVNLYTYVPIPNTTLVFSIEVGHTVYNH